MYRFHTVGFTQNDGLVHYLEVFIINLNENFLVIEVKMGLASPLLHLTSKLH